MSEMLAAAIGKSVPDDLRGALEDLDQGKGWNQSKKAEEWVVDACLRAQRSDVLVEKINQHHVERLTGIRRGAGAVAGLLLDCPALAHLEFCGTAISDDEAASLVLALRDCKGVVTLAFRNCVISGGALSALVAGLPEMQHLQTLRIEAGSGTWVDKLGPGIAAHMTLTSVVLQILNLSARRALELGKRLRRNRTLTMLEVHVASPHALTSLLKGFASTEEFGIDGGSLRVVEKPSALPCLARLDLRSHATLDGAFCDALSECIETRKALASIRIRPDVQALEEPIARLHTAIENSAVKVDFDAGIVPEALAGLAKFLPHQQLILSADAVVGATLSLLNSLPAWGTLPDELQTQIKGDLFGNGTLRDLWPLLSLMGLSKEKRKAAVDIRSAPHCERFAAPMGRRDLPYEPDLDAFMQFWRLQLSGIELGESAALLLPEWQLTSKKSSGLSRDQCKLRKKLKEVGAQLVDEQLKWVGRLIEDGDSDAAAFALPIARRLIREHNFYIESDDASLDRRVVLGEVRYHRRLAAAHLARWLFVGTLVLAVAAHFFDVVMRKLFDQDSAYGIGAPMTLEESFAQRRVIASWMAWPLVAVFAILVLKVEWVDAITRRLGLPQL